MATQSNVKATESDVKSFLEHLGRALSAGDTRTVAYCWAVPGLVLGKDDARPVSSVDEIQAFFGQAVEWYRSRGVAETRPELEGFHRISETMLAVHVRWPGFDQSGRERSSERSFYLIQIGPDGQPRIRVAASVG